MNNIFPLDAQKIISGGEVVVIDVRTPEEFEGGHIPNAKNIDIKDASFEEKIGVLDKDESYIINCQMGGRSARATARMEEMGFKNVKNLLGGISAWKEAGLLIEKSK